MAGILREHGFTRVFALKGGYGAWRKAEYPLEDK
ncbi:MAG: rhodanese-like domain-containing protein [Alphaproteobacteria bacterium]|uniref:Rhodanese-like domain-containing protein n=1 Tax=Candidatus Nitrobium versatile TaxID=2884831 RepID=A0A953JG95_9BACT|nr:rhodanese-like domain-containing protein [Candidatus Nitrobium versatile]